MEDIQSMLADSANALLGDQVNASLLQQCESGVFAQALWDALVALGFPHALVAEVSGGSGLSWAQVYPLVHASGKHALPLPLAETMLARYLLGRATCDPSDDGVFTIAGLTPSHIHSGPRTLAHGVVADVPYARHAQRVVVNADIGGIPHIGWIDLKATGVTLTHGLNIAREARDTLTLDQVPVNAWRPVPDLGRAAVLRYGAMLRAAQIAGATERILEQTLAYASERSQFGRPLAKFQVIQHHMAELGCEAAAVATAAAHAFARADFGHADLEIAAAAIRSGRTAGHAASLAHAVHGAIGFTYEHTLQYATRRLWSWRSEYGSHGWWSQRLGRALCARGPDAWWPVATTGELSMTHELET